MEPADYDGLRLALQGIRRALADVRWRLLERKYRSDQPRIPAGNAESGQWTHDDSWSPSANEGPALQPVANKRSTRVDLWAEEASGSSHAFRDHVSKTNAELRTAIMGEDPPFPLSMMVKSADPEGSFDSRESANRFANDVLVQQSAKVAEVVSGQKGDLNVLISGRLGVVTGREAYRDKTDETGAIRFRPTFGVGVVIRRALNTRGFIVRTAFPMNIYPDRM